MSYFVFFCWLFIWTHFVLIANVLYVKFECRLYKNFLVSYVLCPKVLYLKERPFTHANVLIKSLKIPFFQCFFLVCTVYI